MSNRPTISFAPLDASDQSVTVVLVGSDLSFGAKARGLDKASKSQLTNAGKAADFSGKRKAILELLAVPGEGATRLILAGIGDPANLDSQKLRNLGGVIFGAIAQRPTKSASIIVELAGKTGGKAGKMSTSDMASYIAQGALLRSYKFDKYFTQFNDDETNGKDKAAEGSAGKATKQRLTKLVLQVSDPKAATAAFKRLKAVAEGVFTARDLVNEPANMLGPVEFAAKAKSLEKLGVEVEILDEKALKALKMGALLAVGQGSAQPSRVAVMQWKGAKSKKEPPLAFIGKGVVFDTGGISMKPAGGMEDMKGDMGGAACVLGLMQALAGRKASVNAVGVIGLVENMPSSKATRPGDIVTSMSGQTIEVINTDAEGRLVLADIIHYAQKKFKPQMMIDLATLTGAVIVALGKEHAGLFSNDDELVSQLRAAGAATAEKVWHMPLGTAYDKLINSKNADMKNIGGRLAGSVTAAQFLQRFIYQDDLPWAHLDIAGTAMSSPASDINRSWGSGWGVQLLDRLVADYYE